MFICTVAVYFGVWNFKGAIRRFEREEEPVFTHIGAFWFTVGFMIMAMGLVWHWRSACAEEERGVFWIISFIPLLCIPFGAIRNFNDYQDSLKFDSRPGQSSWRYLLNISTLGLGIKLFAVWLVFAVLHGFAAGFDPQLVIRIILIHFSSYALLCLMVEIYVVYKPVMPKVKLLVGFLIVMNFILPLIMWGVLGVDWVAYFSLFRVWAAICDNIMLSQFSGYSWPIPLVNLLVSVLLARLIIRRYRILFLPSKNQY